MGNTSSMPDLPTDALLAALHRFTDGDDCSLDAAKRLEVLLDEAYPEDDFVQDRVADLALYRPGGGEFLLDEAEMRARLRRLSKYLDAVR